MDERARAEGKLTTDDIHARAIEDVLYFSSLLTFAVFIGLSQTYDGNRSQEKRDKCTAGPEIHRKLIISEVLAFACFLSSSLCAKALKLLITSHEKKRRHYILIAGSFELKGLMLYCTALFSLTGIFALVVSVIHLVQMQVGMYSCANKATRTIIWVFCAIVLIALVLYIISMVSGYFASYDIPRQEEKINGAIGADTDTELQQIGSSSGNRIDVG